MKRSEDEEEKRSDYIIYVKKNEPTTAYRRSHPFRSKAREVIVSGDMRHHIATAMPLCIVLDGLSTFAQMFTKGSDCPIL